MAVTSHDVARLASVSQPTVSRALRDDPSVSEETKRRVRDAAALIGYVPNDAGRALSSGRTKRIGLLVTDLDNQFYSHIIAPVHRELDSAGYQMLLHAEEAGDDIVAERLIANGLDGVILATTTMDSAVPLRLRDRGLPFVYFNRTVSLVDADATVVEPSAGFAAAVARSVELGHRRIAAIFGPENTSTARTREVALRAALEARGLQLDPRYVRRGPFDTDSGDVAATSLLSLDDPPTIIFCGNDVVAYGALNAASRAGASVPDAVSVIGFDGLPASSWSIIQLATISYDIAAMARAAADLVMRRAENPGESTNRLEFPTIFEERRTLGPAA